jgi:magnesium-transporting ATPase (P-type)
VNDAPALNQADIGVAMGIQGTEVAKGASDMILTDDNFCSIVSAVAKGRTIYAGIQKFVAFIMSVHIAEVLQIFICIVADIPVMRTPLQILFLILVTDLPPSIALGMEPGDQSILKAQPRPKEEPIVIGWMWMSINMNGVILSAVIIGVYVIALQHFCEGNIIQTDILNMNDFEANLAKARTVAFISLVYSENIRAYIARSFDQPFWVNLCGNKEMLKAIVLAQIALYVAVLVPGVSDKILGLRGLDIGWWGWAVSLLGPLLTVVLCELAKIITYMQVRQYQAKLLKKRQSEEAKWQRAPLAETLPALMKTPSDPQIVKTVDV